MYFLFLFCRTGPRKGVCQTILVCTLPVLLSLAAACSYGNAYPQPPNTNLEQSKAESPESSPLLGPSETIDSLFEKSLSDHREEIPSGARAVISKHHAVPTSATQQNAPLGEDLQEILNDFDSMVKTSNTKKSKPRQLAHAKPSPQVLYVPEKTSGKPDVNLYEPKKEDAERLVHMYQPRENDTQRLARIYTPPAKKSRGQKTSKQKSKSRDALGNLVPKHPISIQTNKTSSSLKDEIGQKNKNANHLERKPADNQQARARFGNTLGEVATLAHAATSKTLSTYSFVKEILILSVILLGFLFIIGIRLSEEDR